VTGPHPELEPLVSSRPAPSQPRIFRGWFVVAGAFAVTSVGFGIGRKLIEHVYEKVTRDDCARVYLRAVAVS
jgi:hypothetical protein